MIDTVSGSDAGIIVDQLRDAAVIEGAKVARHFGDVGGGAGRVPALPRSVAADDQLAGLRLGGVHNPAFFRGANSDVAMTSGFPQGGLGETKYNVALCNPIISSMLNLVSGKVVSSCNNPQGNPRLSYAEPRMAAGRRGH
jgi:hypothetical protein